MKLLKILIPVILLLVTPIGSANLTPQEIIEARNAVVLVSMKGGFGAGVVINPTGAILTNYHVIHRAEEIKVWFYQRSEMRAYLAKVIAIDPMADLALLEIELDERKLPIKFLEIESDANKINVLDDVYAIGHPVGNQWTVSKGVINSIERAGLISGYVILLQHTAQIQKGNSGGPLINNDMKIVGINTYNLQTAEMYTGFGYATRGDSVAFSVKEMLEKGKVVRPAMGIRASSNHEGVRSQIEERHPGTYMPNTFGVFIFGIEETPHASTHGLQDFDVIIRIDNHVINTMRDINELIPLYKIGDSVDIMIIRDGMFMMIEDYPLTETFFEEYLDFYDDRKTEKPSTEKEEEPKEEEEQPKVEPKPDRPSYVPHGED